MSRVCSILLALVIAWVTVSVPLDRAAKASAMADRSAHGLVAQDPAAPGQNSAPKKRCSHGAGMLACQFQLPDSMSLAAAASAVSARYPSAADLTVRDRSVPTPLRPPKTISA